MTREHHWWPAAVAPRPDGYIVLLDEKGPRIVADSLYLTNEIRLDAQEEYLYVVETNMNHMLRFRVQPDGSLTGKELFGPNNLGLGAAIDGFTFDADGSWPQPAIYHESSFRWPRPAHGLSRLTGDEHASNFPITSGRITSAALEIVTFILTIRGILYKRQVFCL